MARSGIVNVIFVDWSGRTGSGDRRRSKRLSRRLRADSSRIDDIVRMNSLHGRLGADGAFRGVLKAWGGHIYVLGLLAWQSMRGRRDGVLAMRLVALGLYRRHLTDSANLSLRHKIIVSLDHAVRARMRSERKRRIWHSTCCRIDGRECCVWQRIVLRRARVPRLMERGDIAAHTCYGSGSSRRPRTSRFGVKLALRRRACLEQSGLRRRRNWR